MLIRFTVENFMSFKDEVEFSMVAGLPRKHPGHILPGENPRDLRLLKTAVIYGANAAGKSNLIKAMSFAKELIVKGTRGRQNIAVIPFRFDSETKAKPSKFQFEILSQERIYSFGFEVDKTRVHSEWLYEIRSSSEQMIFERETNSEGTAKISPGDVSYTEEQDESFLRFVAAGTRQNQLFLTECIDRNVSYFKDISSWFEDKLVLIFPDTKPSWIEIAFMNDDDYQRDIVELVKHFDLGIDNIRLEDVDFGSENRLPQEIKDQITENILNMSQQPDRRVIIQIPSENILIYLNNDGDIVSKKIMTIHKIEGTDLQERLELTEESDGTQRIFEIVPALFELISDTHERVYIIDELDRRLHALLSYKVLEIFLTKSSNQMSQLVVTTHETNILDLGLLRRDEIWFVEKNAKGASSIYSMEEFYTRYDSDIRRGYLRGRFGAIPLLPSRSILELAD